MNTPEAKLADAKKELNFPPIVVICGSTRFMAEMADVEVCETEAGRIVVKPGCDLKSPNPLWSDPVDAQALKIRLDELHRSKIVLADEVLVVNVRLSFPQPRSPRAGPRVLRSASTVPCHPQG
ncbi:hypothetical protein [Streptomyces sp. NPDC127036]|uniref:hypothetical protein n=1 Tax=Streptomyces sp. NPDC127036 TaxID=3347112 RepID=UPI0036508E4C